VTSAAESAARVRQSVGLFAPTDRGLLAVTGGDRVRWLEGMLSNRVGSLAEGPERSGCYALLLSPKGRIVADLHVLLRDEGFWLELEAAAVAEVRARLERYVIADDVAIADATPDWARLALVGPAAQDLLGGATGAPVTLGEDACAQVTLAGAEVVVAAFGATGLPSFQLFVPPGEVERAADSLRRAASDALVEGDAAALEVLRIEAGLPRLGAELDEEVFPAEARLVERAVSLEKGCYTGQEIVARLHSRGQVNHLLVGLRCEDSGPPAPDTPLRDEREKAVGEVTSACVSATEGAIALAYVRRELAEPGTALWAGTRRVRVAPLPFVGSGG
jgi:folate-binding protein YgfZ